MNEQPQLIESAIGIGPIHWRSPVANDEHAEYRDSMMLERMDIKLPKRSLASFWPTRGPQWDALGRAASGDLVLVEAKAHVGELLSPSAKASGDSLSLIKASLAETAIALGAAAGAADWSQFFYQYTNRLAHAYLFRELNGLPTLLVFLYFIGDADMDGPRSRREWDAALAVLHEAVGLRGHVPKWVRNAFIDVRTSEASLSQVDR